MVSVFIIDIYKYNAKIAICLVISLLIQLYLLLWLLIAYL
ncbi:hypothetical protein HMPREF2533_03223 [Bacteroides fragilis]|nr:hypothetical protein HMPREF2530_03223 [Bacteroides fragilis]KXU43416.1 hypothetical protein HMPREF2533_03223 [Bacteroides fragilis]